MQDFHRVDAWQKAHGLVLRVYEETHSLPREEMYGVTALLRKTSVAVASRIVEGCGRQNNAGFSADLHRAVTACNELEYYFLLAKDLKLLPAARCAEMGSQAVEVRKMIYGLLRKL